MVEVSGSHIAFYYFGLEHLLVNIYRYIKEGIENNQIIYLSMEPELFEELSDNLYLAGIPGHYLELYSISDMILECKEDKEKLNKYILELNANTLAREYSGFRLISQATYSITATSKGDFLKFERSLSQCFKQVSSSILCIYDFEDFAYNKGVIDGEVIIESHNTHSYILSEMTLKKPEELFADYL